MENKIEAEGTAQWESAYYSSMCKTLQRYLALKRKIGKGGCTALPSGLLLIVLVMCMRASCMWIYAHESGCLQRPEVSDAVGPELHTVVIHLTQMLRIESRFSRRAASAF